MRFRQVFRNNGLSLTLLTLFLVFWAAQWLTGWLQFNEEQEAHGLAVIGAWAYLSTGHFWQATGENWESEFLQMALFVMLTVFLFQKGSPESKDPDHEDDDAPLTSASPWPARRGGVWRMLYRYSLTIALTSLFLVSLGVHAVGGWQSQADDDRRHDRKPPSFVDYMTSSRFWFESMQNWQSEFLSLVAMVYLSVYLRHDGSAESKSVNTPHDEQ